MIFAIWSRSQFELGIVKIEDKRLLYLDLIVRIITYIHL